MSIEKVKSYFETFDLQDRILEFELSSATVDLAAIAVGANPDEIAKTLSFMTSEGPLLIVMSGRSRVDNHKYKHTFGQKAKMLAFEETEEIIGHAAGGVCPFVINEGVKVYLDESIKKYAYVYPAAGNSNSAIKLTPKEVEKYSSNFISWVDVCKMPENI